MADRSVLRHGVVAGILLALAPASRAAAQPVAVPGDRVGVVARASPQPPVDGAAAAAAIAAALTDGGAEVEAAPIELARERVAAGAVPAARLAAFRRARQLSDEGWNAYLGVEMPFAQARLAEARRTAGEVLDLDGGGELLAEVSLRLGAVLLYQARTAEADAAFRLAAALDPERPVTAAEFRPEVVDAYRAAIAQPAPPARLRVTTEPIGATVAIDGHEVGLAPIEVATGQGQHVVSARAALRATTAQLVAVEGAEAAVDLTLPAHEATLLAQDGLLAIGSPERDARREAEMVITYADLDGLLLVAPLWRRGEPALLGQWCSGVPVTCGAVIEIAARDAAAAARELAVRAPAGVRRFPPTLLADARLVLAEAPPGKKPPPPPPDHWYQNGWLWVGVAGVAVAGGVAAVLSSGGDGETTFTLRCDQFFPNCPTQ